MLISICIHSVYFSSGRLNVLYVLMQAAFFVFFQFVNNCEFFVLKVSCVFRELLDQHPENIRMIMTHTIYNELSNTKNPNNMAIITTLFQKNGEQSARVGIYRSSSHNSVQVQCTSSKGTMFTSCKIN